MLNSNFALPEISTVPPEVCPTQEPEVDFCASDPCQNGGGCHNIMDGYVCVCGDFYHNGVNCEGNRVFPHFWSRTFIEFSEFSEFGELITEA